MSAKSKVERAMTRFPKEEESEREASSLSSAEEQGKPDPEPEGRMLPGGRYPYMGTLDELDPGSKHPKRRFRQ